MTPRFDEDEVASSFALFSQGHLIYCRPSKNERKLKDKRKLVISFIFRPSRVFRFHDKSQNQILLFMGGGLREMDSAQCTH